MDSSHQKVQPVEEGSTQQKPDKRYESGDEDLKIARCTRSVKYQNVKGAPCLKIQTGDTTLCQLDTISTYSHSIQNYRAKAMSNCYIIAITQAKVAHWHVLYIMGNVKRLSIHSYSVVPFVTEPGTYREHVMANRDAEIVPPSLLKNLKHPATRCISKRISTWKWGTEPGGLEFIGW